MIFLLKNKIIKKLLILFAFLNCTINYAQNDTISQIIKAYDKWDDDLCNNLIKSYNEKNTVITSERDSIDYNIYKCIKGYQMPFDLYENYNFTTEYLTSLRYLFKKDLGDYLPSFVNDLYLKSNLISKNESTILKSEMLSLLEESAKYSLKDHNKSRFFSKIDHFNTLKNISFLFNNLNPNQYEESLIKVNSTLSFFEENKSFLESKGFNNSKLFYLFKFKLRLLYYKDNNKEKIAILNNLIEILYQYKNGIDTKYIEYLDLYYDLLGHECYKAGSFQILINLITKYNDKNPVFDLSEIKLLLEATTISQKQMLIEKIICDIESNKISIFKLKALSHLMDYLILPYGHINELKVKSAEEKKLIIHYYYVKYLLEKNNDWNWADNPDYRLISKKVALGSFGLVYNSLHSSEIDINFKNGGFDLLKAKGQIIQEIINSKNPYILKLNFSDFIDKIDYEISEHHTEINKSDDEFIINVLHNNISKFKQINTKYTDFVVLLSLINNDIQKLVLGFDSSVAIEKTNKLRDLIKSNLKEDINIDDLDLRINICNNLEDLNKIKNFIESSFKLNKIELPEYVKLINNLNFLEYDFYEENNKSKFASNDNLLSLANKTYTFFISNLESLNDYSNYIRIVNLIKQYDFPPNLQLINKVLSFYNDPGNMFTNIKKYYLDQCLGKLYFRIKNYSKARMYFYAANANTLIYEDPEIVFQKWDLLLNIYYCIILDQDLSKIEIYEKIKYLKGIYETDIDRIEKLNFKNSKKILIEIKYRYNTICLHEVREQKDLNKEKKILLEQLEINKTLNLFNDFYTELDLIKCKSKLNKISTTESFKLITDLYKKYNKKQDISFALACEELKDYNSSFNIQLNTYSEELLNNLNYINKLSYTNQQVFFNELWDHRQYILRPYFKLAEEDKQKNLNRLIQYFILSDNIDGNDFNLYANNESEKINELILEKKKLINNESSDEDYNKISNNIDLLQQKLKFKENNINWNLQLLKDNLKENQAYIRIFGHKQLDYFGYYAFVVTKTNSKLIDLNENKLDFEKAFNAYIKNIKEQVDSPIAYDVFYAKIFNALPKETTELFFQNEGVYINLNPDGFKSNSTQKYLVETYNIHTINTSYLFKNLDSQINFENALFIGNPRFKESETKITNTSIAANKTRGSILLPLPNTQNEVVEVAKLLNINNIKTKCLLQEEASEVNLNKLSSSYDLIHIATHGFYKDDGTDKINQYDFGLYLTGALDYINNNQVKSQMIDEGIIYAPEIELLNLSKAKLVVLSACETGFGRQSKIGKISLSSSFIMAGAKNVLSTLWKVDDKVTMEFINEFYKKLLHLKNIKSALRQTQLEFLEKYKSPYYWAPFMLLQNRG